MDSSKASSAPPTTSAISQPRVTISNASTPTTTIPNLTPASSTSSPSNPQPQWNFDKSYVIQVDPVQRKLHIILKCGQDLTPGQVQTLMGILNEKGINKPGLAVFILKNTNDFMYGKAGKGAKIVVWTNPSRTNAITFLVKVAKNIQLPLQGVPKVLRTPGAPISPMVNRATGPGEVLRPTGSQMGLKRPHSLPMIRPPGPGTVVVGPQGPGIQNITKQVIPSQSKPVEVIDLDSDEEDDDEDDDDDDDEDDDDDDEDDDEDDKSSTSSENSLPASNAAPRTIVPVSRPQQPVATPPPGKPIAIARKTPPVGAKPKGLPTITGPTKSYGNNQILSQQRKITPSPSSIQKITPTATASPTSSLPKSTKPLTTSIKSGAKANNTKSATATVTTPTTKTVRSTEQQHRPYSMVVRGYIPRNNKSPAWKLPKKCIVPTSKCIPALYKIPDLEKFHQDFKDIEVTYSVHPFLGDQFMQALPNIPKVEDVDENKCPPSVDPVKAKDKPTPVQNKRVLAEKEQVPEQVTNSGRASRARSSSSISQASVTEGLRSRQPLRSTRANETKSAMASRRKISEVQPPPSKKRKVIVREMTPDGSSSDDSSDSSSSSGSSNSNSEDDSSDFEPVEPPRGGSDSEGTGPNLRLRSRTRNRQVVTNRNSSTRSIRLRSNISTRGQEPQDASRSYKHISEMPPCRPVRKRSDGRIYFSLKARLTPDQYYKNVDLFDNWGKFVRNESCVTTYYKTSMERSIDLTSLIIYHLGKQEGKHVVDRTVQLVSDGTIKITLEDLDVTETFMKRVQIETTNDLQGLLINLKNSSLCAGVPDFTLISIFPGAFYLDDVWYSLKCSKIVLDPDHDIFHTRASCPSCTELRKHLQNEKTEIERMSVRVKKELRKNFNRHSAHVKIIKSKPPPVEQLQVRQGLDNLLLNFWDELGLFPPCKVEADPTHPTPVLDSAVTNTTTLEVKLEDMAPSNISSIPPPTSTLPLETPPPPAPPSESENNLTVLQPATGGMHIMPQHHPEGLIDSGSMPLAPGATYLTLQDIQLNPSDIQIMNIPEFSNEMIASLMNTSDPVDNSLTLTGQNEGYGGQHLMMDIPSMPHLMHPSTGPMLGGNDVTCVTYSSNNLISSTNISEPGEVSERIPLMFPTFSLMDDM